MPNAQRIFTAEPGYFQLESPVYDPLSQKVVTKREIYGRKYTAIKVEIVDAPEMTIIVLLNEGEGFIPVLRLSNNCQSADYDTVMGGQSARDSGGDMSFFISYIYNTIFS